MLMQRGAPVGVAVFIGRARERGKVADLLAETRMVTLTGSGGCGKTRLAMEVTADVVACFTDGATCGNTVRRVGRATRKSLAQALRSWIASGWNGPLIRGFARILH